MTTRFIRLLSLSILPCLVKPQLVGPKPCPLAQSVMGYDNTTILTDDIIATINDILQQKTAREEEYVYTLCPNTVFDMGTDLRDDEFQHMAPIITLLHNTTIRCGEDGRWTNNCTLKGGWTHVHLEDDVTFFDAIFRGITFESSEGTSIQAFGKTTYSWAIIPSDVTFVSCVWKYNSKSDAVVHIFWHPGLRAGVEPSNGGGRSLRKNNNLLPEGEENVDVNVMNKTKSDIKEYPLHPELRSKLDQLRQHENWEKFQVENYMARHGRRASELVPSSSRRLQHVAMMVTIGYSVFLGNSPDQFLILNDGGLLDLVATDFHYNSADSLVATIDFGALALRNGTTFYNNVDFIGPVYLDRNSSLLYHDDSIVGANNTVGIDKCEDIFFDVNYGSKSCFKDFDGCKGMCCEFEDESCDKITFPPEDSPLGQQAPTASVETSPPPGPTPAPPPPTRSPPPPPTPPNPTPNVEEDISERSSSSATASSSKGGCDEECQLGVGVGVPLGLLFFCIFCGLCFVGGCCRKGRKESDYVHEDPPVENLPDIE